MKNEFKIFEFGLILFLVLIIPQMALAMTALTSPFKAFMNVCSGWVQTGCVDDDMPDKLEKLYKEWQPATAEKFLTNKTNAEKVSYLKIQCKCFGGDTPSPASDGFFFPLDPFLILLLIPVIFLFSVLSLPISLSLLAGIFIIIIYLMKGLKICKFYLLPVFLGFIGGIIGFFASKDKKLRKRLLIAGFFISLICFFVLYLFVLTNLWHIFFLLIRQ